MSHENGISALDAEMLLSRSWRFFHKGGSFASSDFRFERDGSIAGYDHPNERGWLLTRNSLILIDERGTPTAIFDDVTRQDGCMTLIGRHLPVPDIVLCLQEDGGSLFRPHLTRDALRFYIAKYGWRIGDHTYGTPTILDGAYGMLEIGRYTSISASAVICIANHRVDSVTTYPFRVLSNYWPTADRSCRDHASKGATSIGSDVWIGHHAFIGSGVAIGDGAVIGANATVTKDVPAYAIVAGNPGRVVKHRFRADIVERLLQIRWWDLKDSEVEVLIPSMFKSDFSEFFALASSFGRGEGTAEDPPGAAADARADGRTPAVEAAL